MCERSRKILIANGDDNDTNVNVIVVFHDNNNNLVMGVNLHSV